MRVLSEAIGRSCPALAPILSACRIAVNQEFLGETEAKVSGLTLQQELPDTTYQVGGGIDIALPKSGVSFTVDADYTFGEEADGVSATGGFRINW